MDENLRVTDEVNFLEKTKIFFAQNKKKIIVFFGLIILLLITYFFFKEYKDNQKIKVSNNYNSALISYSKDDKSVTAKKLIEIIEVNDETYSPLSLYFIIDNKLIEDKSEINRLFDILINQSSSDDEIINLIIYKKGLYNADTSDESQLLNILNPLINSKSVWKSHALYLLAEFFYSKGEKEKSKEFFKKIIQLDESNPDIMVNSKIRLQRDLGEK